ncbi:hypothetical protein MSG28_012528, partial [Choristoneura fumiferana]
ARFSVLHREASDDWDLRVEYVQPRDAGVYECQINTEPKINMAVFLTVEAAAASIWGSQDVYVKKGSTISLTFGERTLIASFERLRSVARSIHAESVDVEKDLRREPLLETEPACRVVTSNENCVSKEEQLTEALKKSLPGTTYISVEDISGGCGAMFEVSIEAKEFIGLPRVKQHRLVTDSLKQEISEMHGIRIHTNPTPTEQVIAIKTSLQWVNLFVYSKYNVRFCFERICNFGLAVKKKYHGTIHTN